eukprot:3520614-Pyramimonas_sp.AAC.1
MRRLIFARDIGPGNGEVSSCVFKHNKANMANGSWSDSSFLGHVVDLEANPSKTRTWASGSAVD